MRELLFPTGATRFDWILDIALTIGLELVAVPIFIPGFVESHSSWAILSSILMVLPLLIRRHSPFLSLVGIMMAWAFQLAVWDNMMPSLIAISVISYSIARWIPSKPARIVIFVGAVTSIVGPIRWFFPDPSNSELENLMWFTLATLACIGLVITPYSIGRRVRESAQTHQHLVKNAEERYKAQLVEREQQTRITEAQVRTQIARELHDIVAHSLSVMIVQAEGGKALASKKPEVAIEALDTIAKIGRESLGEMRRILGVLRADPKSNDSADFAPAPKLADIPELVARTTDRATLKVTGTTPNVSQALQLTVYRVVQEALTNFLKHAGSDAQVKVSLQYGGTNVAFDIADDGAGAAAATDNPGHGLKGMQERVTSMGGWLTTGPKPEGGFQIRGVIPLKLSDKE